MSMAIAPRRSRGRWWFALTLSLPVAGSGLSLSEAQEPPAQKKGEATRAKDDAKGKDEKKDEAAPPAAKVEEIPDRWEDPRAEDALHNNFPEMPAVLSRPEDKTLIDQLARGQGQLDLDAITRFVKSRAHALTNRNNLKALMDPAGNPTSAKAIEAATADLINPLLQPANAANAVFRQRYVAKLLEVFNGNKIWKGNLHSRTMAMIVLSRAGEAQAVPTFTAQLDDPDQLAVVKMLSAIGITAVAQNGQVPPSSEVSVPAARALSNFLLREPDTFWFVQFRALEALGALRLATDKALGGKAEFAETALVMLTDPKAAPDVRAWASWALGMMSVPPAVNSYNFSLVAHAIGQAAADLGEKIAALPAGNRDRVRRLTDVMMQLNHGFTGEPNVRNSGLLHENHPAAGPALGYVSEVAKRVLTVTKTSVELSDAAGNQVVALRKALTAAVDDLRAFLSKPSPGGRTLYAGGREFPDAAPPKVAAGARR